MPEKTTAASGSPTEDARLAKIKAMIDAQRAGAQALTTFQVNDVYAFDTDVRDLAYTAAEQAHAVCIVLGNAVDMFTDDGTESMCLRPIHISAAISAISTLIGLSQFAQQAIES